MSGKGRYQRFIELMETFVSGEGRSRSHVGQMESEFARHFDDDPRFVEMQYLLAMYGAHGYDDVGDLLVKECVWALKTLWSEDTRSGEA